MKRITVTQHVPLAIIVAQALIVNQSGLIAFQFAENGVIHESHTLVGLGYAMVDIWKQLTNRRDLARFGLSLKPAADLDGI